MKHAQRQKKKNITTQRKQIYIIITIITIITRNAARTKENSL